MILSRTCTCLSVFSSVLSIEYFSMIYMHVVLNYNAMHLFYNIYTSSVYISTVYYIDTLYIDCIMLVLVCGCT